MGSSNGMLYLSLGRGFRVVSCSVLLGHPIEQGCNVYPWESIDPRADQVMGRFPVTCVHTPSDSRVKAALWIEVFRFENGKSNGGLEIVF